LRIFIALLFDEKNRKTIFDYAGKIQEYSETGNYTTLNNLHLTMLFIGQTELNVVNEIYSKLSQIKSSKFEYETGKIKFFKKSGNRKILYLSLKDTYRLKELYVKIVAKINELGMNFSTNKFTPHITLARQVRLNEDFKDDMYQVKSLKLVANRISIMESTRIDGELVYQELYSIPLE
jgi:RNA 2',3'-cyclic 3'-phosphodiesterase